MTVQLLLHCDGADGSTTFTDSSINSFTVTPAGNTQIDTAQSKFGGASAVFDGTGDWLSLNGESAFAFGTSDFTIDFWLRPTTSVTFLACYDTRPLSTAGLYPTIRVDSGTVHFHVSGSNVISSSTSLSLNTWYHIAVSRSGTSTKLFIDGTQEGSTYADSNNYINPANRPRIGGSGFSETDSMTGWIDELRVTNTAEYTANFTPPTSAYSDPPITWPTTLPQCPILEFSEQRQRNVVAFVPEVGRPKMRRRSTAAQVRTKMVFRMNNTQLVTFNTFYEDTIADGTLPFSMNHPRTTTSHTWVFAPEDAPEITRFAPNRSRVSFELLRLD